MSLNDFKILDKLGEGAYSNVYKVQRIQDDQIYALKKVRLTNLSEKEKENALNEVRILASINNKYVISYKEGFFDEASHSLCIIMEFADNGDLFQKIRKHQKSKMYIDEDEIWKIFIQVLRGLKALHDLKIMHRDLKSANVFLYKDYTAKLGDLNVSKVAKQGLGYTQTGTPYYASPEVWQDKPYDFKSDIWSLGCVLYESIALKPPFRAEDMEGLYKKVLRGVYPKLSSKFSKDLSLIIKAILKVNPSKRPSCSQIMNTNIISSRLNTLFPNEINDSENILLQTIYIPKKMSHLTDRLPKSTYEDNYSSDEDETVMTKFVDHNLNNEDSLPRIPAKKILPTINMTSQSSVKKMEHMSQLGKHSDYSFDSQNHLQDGLQIISKSAAPNSKDTSMGPSHNSSINTIPVDYEGIYNNKPSDMSAMIVKNKLAVRPHHIISNNASEPKVKQRRTPLLNKKDGIPNLKIDLAKNGYKHIDMSNVATQEQSRNNSVVALSTKENKSVSRSRPKQRHPKLIIDDEQTSSILRILEKNQNRLDYSINHELAKEHMPKILASSEEQTDARTERSKKRDYSVGKMSSLHTPSIHKSKAAVDRPHDVAVFNRKHSLQRRKKGNISLVPTHLNILEKYSGESSKHAIIKGVRKELKRINNIYTNGKPKYNIARANSQLDSIKKSVSIVSISPSENMHHHSKDILNYNPYSRHAGKHKIHLPYLRKNKKQISKVRKDNSSKRRNERVINNVSFDLNRNKISENKSIDLMKEINVMKKRRPRPKIEDFQYDYSGVNPKIK